MIDGMISVMLVVVVVVIVTTFIFLANAFFSVSWCLPQATADSRKWPPVRFHFPGPAGHAPGCSAVGMDWRSPAKQAGLWRRSQGEAIVPGLSIKE